MTFYKIPKGLTIILILPVLTVTLLLTNCNESHQPYDVSGNWIGTWQSTSGDEISGTVMADVHQEGTELSGTITIPELGIIGSSLIGTTDGAAMVFGDIADMVSFTGTLSDASNASGTYDCPSADNQGSWSGQKKNRDDIQGGLDPAFGQNGVSRPDIRAFPMVIMTQTGGRIIVGGASNAYIGPDTDVVLSRLLKNGALDTSFGINGIAVLALSETDESLTDAVITAGDQLYLSIQSMTAENTTTATIARCSGDGILDTSFADAGKISLALTDAQQVEKLAVQADQKLLAVGIVEGGFGVFRFDTNGNLDDSFGQFGKQLLPLGEGTEIGGIRLLSNGQIIIAGTADNDVIVCRLNTDGSLDTNFGTEGVVRINTGSDDIVYDLELTLDEKIVVAGYSELSVFDDTLKFVILQLQGNGTPDLAFGTNGIQVFNGPRSMFIFANIAIRKDGKIRGIGLNQNVFGHFQCRDTGALDDSYGVGGQVITRLGSSGGWDYPTTLTLDDNDKTIVAGIAASGSLVIARYL